jgi:hypothetical protein
MSHMDLTNRERTDAFIHARISTRLGCCWPHGEAPWSYTRCTVTPLAGKVGGSNASRRMRPSGTSPSSEAIARRCSPGQWCCSKTIEPITVNSA